MNAGGARGFTRPTTLLDDRLSLALAPGLDPSGPNPSPSFFHGFATHPQVLARGLVTLADITATRYFKYVPVSERDPILSAHGDRLRAECFSACNGVYACLELDSSGLDGGEIGRGTTNVDVGPASRALLTNLARHDLLHLDVGAAGLRAATLDGTVHERPVEMPPRWVPALGNAAQLHQGFVEAFRVPAPGARAFLAALPPASATDRSAWVSAAGQSVKVSQRQTPGAVLLAGLHRLSALKRLLPHVRGLVFFVPTGGAVGAMVTLELPHARVTLGLTDEVWRGYSGEGSLLASLAEEAVSADADLVSALLAFEPIIDVSRLSRDTALSQARVRAALAVLAADGRVGWDVNDRAFFHRELPDSPDRVTKDNPRLVAARKLVAAGAVRKAGAGAGAGAGAAHKVGATGAARPEGDLWLVSSAGSEYPVHLGPGPTPEKGATCSCTWYLAHAGNRGPCKHVLAVILRGKEKA